MAEAVKLKVATREPDQGVIDVLEKALVRARSGELRGVLLVGDMGGRYYSAGTWDDGPTLLGYLTLQTNMVCRVLDQNADQEVDDPNAP